MKAVEKEKDELEGSKNEAMEYINMENSITKQRNVLFQRYMCVIILFFEKNKKLITAPFSFKNKDHLHHGDLIICLITNSLVIGMNNIRIIFYGTGEKLSKGRRQNIS